MKFLNSFLLTTVFVFIASASFAQTAEVDVAAEVLADVNVSEIRSIDFGVIGQDITSNNPTLDETSAATNANIITGGVIGVVQVTGTAGQNVIFASSSFDVVELIHDTDTDYVVDFTPSLVGETGLTSTANASGGATSFTSGTGAFALTGGEYSFYIGGTLDNPVDDGTGGSSTTTTLLAGNYEGSITVEIDYE